MARKLSKRDEIIWNIILSSRHSWELVGISLATDIDEGKVLISLKNLISHGVVKKDGDLYKAV